jgi:hypothetical protein
MLAPSIPPLDSHHVPLGCLWPQPHAQVVCYAECNTWNTACINIRRMLDPLAALPCCIHPAHSSVYGCVKGCEGTGGLGGPMLSQAPLTASLIH